MLYFVSIGNDNDLFLMQREHFDVILKTVFVVKQKAYSVQITGEYNYASCSCPLFTSTILAPVQMCFMIWLFLVWEDKNAV